MEKRFVEFNGTRVVEGWPEKIVAAQAEKTYVIGKVTYQRVPYGEEIEDLGADSHPCDDCAVIKGQLHVPGCNIERCPACGAQVLACDCDYEGDEEEQKA